MFKQLNTVQNYGWGKTGKDSKIYNFVKSQQDQQTSESSNIENEKMAELWFGGHPKASSIVIFRSQNSEGDQQHQEQQIPVNKFQSDYLGLEPLQFQFKILSIEKCLSIQSHPDKKLAEDLHRVFPDVYPDDNHKPEMSVTLTDFEAFSNFSSLFEIIENLRRYKSLDDWLLLNSSVYDTLVEEFEKSKTNECGELSVKVFFK